MKNRIFSFISLLLFVFISNAQENSDLNRKPDFVCGSFITSYNNEVTEYKFKSIDALNDGLEEIIKDFDFNNSENKKDVCEIVLELKIEIAVGVSTILKSEVIKTNCNPEAANEAVKRFKAMISAVIIG